MNTQRTASISTSPALGTTTRVVLPGLVEPTGLQVTTVPIPTPGVGQLLVQVEATGISFAEQAMRRGRYPGQPKFPFTPGYDLVGRVIGVGSKRDVHLIGQRVATMTKTGAWTGHAVVAARDSVIVPDGISPEEAETVVVNGVTAWQILHRTARMKSGQTVLLFGANGGVGGILIQLAKLHGVRVIGASSPRYHDALRAAGVTPVDYADPNLEATVRALAPEGIDAVVENIGGDITRMGFGLLNRGGIVVTTSLINAAQGTGSMLIPFAKSLGQALLWTLLPNGKRATFYDLWSGHVLHPSTFRRHLEHDLTEVLTVLKAGKITANIAARFPLTEIVAAQQLAESRTLNGKVILLP